MTEMLYYWMGTPLSELPREELEKLFIEARKEIDDMNEKYLRAKTEHIHDLATIARRKR